MTEESNSSPIELRYSHTHSQSTDDISPEHMSLYATVSDAAEVLKTSLSTSFALQRPASKSGRSGKESPPLLSPDGSNSASTTTLISPRASGLNPTSLLSPRIGGLARTSSGIPVSDYPAILDLVSSQTVLGAGILGYPFVFRECGFLLALLLVSLILVASEFSSHLLILSGHIASRRSYSELAMHCFGATGRFLVDLCGIIMALGSVVACLNIGSDVFSLVAGSIIPPGAEPSRHMILAGVTLCAAMPVAVFAQNSSGPLVKATHRLSGAFLMLFCGLLIALSFLPSAVGRGEIRWWNWNGLLVSFPVVAYSFTAHQAIFAVHTSMKGATLKRTTHVIQRAMVLSCVVYVLIGVCGFLVFGQRTSGDILRNLGGGASHPVRLSLERVTKVSYGLLLLLSIPLTLLPLHSTLFSWNSATSNTVLSPRVEPLNGSSGGLNGVMHHNHGGGSSNTSNFTDTLKASTVTYMALGLACAAAVFLPNVEFVLGLMGSTAAIIISFLLPSAIFLRTTSSQRGSQGHGVDLSRGSPAWIKKRRLAAALLILGAVAGVACTSSLVSAILEENQVVALATKLAKEERRAATAYTTGAAAKEVAEGANAVSEARRQLDVRRTEANPKFAALTRAMGALEETRASLKKRRAAVKELNDDLSGIIDEAEQASVALEGAVSALIATEQHLLQSRKREAGNGVAAAATNLDSGSTTGQTEGTVGAVLAETKAGQTATETIAQITTLQDGDVNAKPIVDTDSGSSSKNADELLQGEEGILFTLSAAANESLAAVRASKDTLTKVQNALRQKGAVKNVEELDSMLQTALNATFTASRKMNDTYEALQQAELRQVSQLAGIVADLTKEESAVGIKAAAAAQVVANADLSTSGTATTSLNNKTGSGFIDGANKLIASSKTEQQQQQQAMATAFGRKSSPGDTATKDGDTTTTVLSQADVESAIKLSELELTMTKLSQNDSTAGTVNVSTVALEAVAAAAQVVESAKANLEEALHSNKEKVAERAIEIAKELSQPQLKQQQNSGDKAAGTVGSGAASSGAVGGVLADVDKIKLSGNINATAVNTGGGGGSDVIIETQSALDSVVAKQQEEKKAAAALAVQEEVVATDDGQAIREEQI